MTTNILQRIIFLSILTTSSLVTEAQHQEPGAGFGVSIGPAFPLGSFGNRSDFFTTHAGNARTGIAYGLALSFKINEYLRIPVDLQGIRNPFHGQMIARQIYNDNPDSFVTVETDSWKSNAIMTGLTLTLLLNKGGGENIPAFIDVSARIGINDAESYFYRVEASGITNIIPLRQASVEDTGFAQCYGIRFRHGLSSRDRIDLSLSIDYFRSNHNFSGAEIRSSDGSETQVSFDQTFETLNVKLGVILLAY